MAEFQELVKNFERIRDYVRQFYIYGFKVRNEYDTKSSRTYDDERRRIESYLNQFIRSDYTAKGKQLSISVDSLRITQNPLYAAWKSKSFTDNDIMLHFFISGILTPDVKLTAGELCDKINDDYGVLFDVQTVRNKLKEYEKKQLIVSEKEGRTICYGMARDVFENNPKEYGLFLDAIKFFMEAAPFGFVGSTILDREYISNDLFVFKHNFIVHTLEDGVCSQVIDAMEKNAAISFINKSNRTGNETSMEGIPLKIFVSTMTGRRYACIYSERKQRFLNIRLDAMSKVKQLEEKKSCKKLKQLLKKNLHYCWGVSFGGRSRMEEIYIKLRIDEQRESYILERIRREGRGGELIEIEKNIWLYSGKFYDTNEMLPWVKSFTGRIIEINGSNQTAIAKVNSDLDSMYEMYFQDGSGSNTGLLRCLEKDNRGGENDGTI